MGLIESIKKDLAEADKSRKAAVKNGNRVEVVEHYAGRVWAFRKVLNVLVGEE